MQAVGGIRITLCGRLRAVSAAGQDVTPRSAKAQGLLALLATSPNRGRARGWLQAKLWSDRPEAQAGASLRQALTEVRRALGPLSGCLKADRQSVALDADRVEIDDRGPGEFLEGLDLRDQEFESWLRDERAARAPAPRASPFAADLSPPVPDHPAVLFLRAPDMPRDHQLFADVFTDCVARSLSEAMTVDVFTAASRAVPAHAVAVLVQVFAQGDRIGLRATLHDNGRLWDESWRTEARDGRVFSSACFCSSYAGGWRWRCPGPARKSIPAYIRLPGSGSRTISKR